MCRTAISLDKTYWDRTPDSVSFNINSPAYGTVRGADAAGRPPRAWHGVEKSL